MRCRREGDQRRLPATRPQVPPDRSKEPGADQRFKEIAEAYTVLSDPEKRAEYDAGGGAGTTLLALLAENEGHSFTRCCRNVRPMISRPPSVIRSRRTLTVRSPAWTVSTATVMNPSHAIRASISMEKP